MKSFTTIAILACIAVAWAEPPPPQNQYLPPKQPQSNYLPPSNSYQAPSNSYQAPSNTYQPPSNNYLPPRGGQGGGHQSGHSSQQQYSAPSITTAIFPSRQQSSSGGSSGFQGYSNSRQGENSGYGNNGYGGNNNDEESYGPAKYEFKYDVQDYQSGNDFGHMESRDGDLATGLYYVLLPDGRKQIVRYEADKNGYRPTITYEQVGNGGAGGSGGGGYDNNAQPQQFNGYQ